MNSYIRITLLCIFLGQLQTAIANNVGLTDTSQIIRVHVPLGGNSWIKDGRTEKITGKGLINWTDAKSVIETYVRFAKAGKIKLFLKASINGKSKIRITFLGKSKEMLINGNNEEYDTGEWEIADAGYAKISVQGISKTATNFADLSEWILEGSAVNDQTVYVWRRDDGLAGQRTFLLKVLEKNWRPLFFNVRGGLYPDGDRTLVIFIYPHGQRNQ